MSSNGPLTSEQKFARRVAKAHGATIPDAPPIPRELAILKKCEPFLQYVERAMEKAYLAGVEEFFDHTEMYIGSDEIGTTDDGVIVKISELKGRYADED